MKGLSWYTTLLRTVILALNMPTYQSMDKIMTKPHNQVNFHSSPYLEHRVNFYSKPELSFMT